MITKFTGKRLPSIQHLLWIFPLILFAPTLVRGGALVWGTPSLQFIPWRILAWEQFRAGFLPFWNPLNGMGAPLLANYQLAFFYPPGWLLYALKEVGGNEWMAWGHTLVLAAHLSWAGYGVARLIRQLGLSELSQVAAGLAFSLSSYLIARAGFFSMVWSAAWLPWIVYLVEKIGDATTEAKRWNTAAYMGLCVGMQLLSGHAQLTFYSLVFAVSWSLVVGIAKGEAKPLWKTMLFTGIACVIGAAVAAVQLIPTFELLQQSQRAAAVDFEIAMTYSFWPWRLLTFLAPGFFGNPAYGDYWGYASYWEDAVYMGLLPFLMALTTAGKAFSTKNDHQGVAVRMRALWCFVVVGTLLALGSNTPIFPFLYENVPTFNMFQAPARYMLWTVFSLSILAAYGIENWKRPTGKAMRRLRRTPVVLVAAIVGAGAAFFIVPDIKSSFIYSTLGLCIIGLVITFLTIRKPNEANSPQIRKWRWAVGLLVGFDLLIAGWGQNPSAPAQFFAESNDQSANGNTIKTERLFMDDQTEYHLKFDRFLRFEDYRPLEDWIVMRAARLPNLNILDQVPSVNNFDPLRPARYDRLMKHVSSLSYEERLPWLISMGVTQIESVDPENNLEFVFDSLDGSQRIRFTPCAVFANGEADAWEKTQAMIENGLNHTVIEDESVQGFNCNLKYNDKISILSEQANRLVLSVEVTVDGWLSVADTWYPGWKVNVDGVDTDLYRANYSFRGIKVLAGKHIVVFEYKPDWWLSAVMVSVAGVLAIIVLLFVRR